MTPEGIIQAKIKRFLNNRGWYVIKIISASPNNLPDLIAFKKCYTLWVEVKTEKGKLSPLQIYRHKEIKKKIDHDVMVPYGYDHFLKLYKDREL